MVSPRDFEDRTQPPVLRSEECNTGCSDYQLQRIRDITYPVADRVKIRKVDAQSSKTVLTTCLSSRSLLEVVC
ncbi:hypothetical protein TNCV_1308841 [Trichonephila clavipes]|nr:hypothetical protein TNCV_1308841 [Trichonephila clavipes]